MVSGTSICLTLTPEEAWAVANAITDSVHNVPDGYPADGPRRVWEPRLREIAGGLFKEARDA